MTYTPKTQGFPHQVEALEKTWDKEAYAFFWEQGTGKTWVAVNTMCKLYLEGRINGMFVVAPNGVHRNWMREIDKHGHDDVTRDSLLMCWESRSAKLKFAEAQRKALMAKRGPGLRILLMSYDALLTTAGKAFAKRFLQQYNCLYVPDESQKFKNPGAKRSKTVVASGVYAPYRRILSGTPIAQGPFDVYTQIAFLDAKFWRRESLHPFSCFKAYFGVFQRVTHDRGAFDMLVRYRNLDELHDKIHSIGHRLTKESAGVKLPPKLYTTTSFDLTPKVKKVYKELVEGDLVQLPDTDSWLVTETALAKLTRLQQICCGYVATEADDPVQEIDPDNPNPRLAALWANIEDNPGKAIIWAKYNGDMDRILSLLKKNKRKAARYDGQVGTADREAAIDGFQNGDIEFFVAKQQSAAEGLTLNKARVVHYYSQGYNYDLRAQSEDRAHRIGLEHPVLYIDYVAQGTLELDIIENLRKKNSLAQQLLGDAEKSWI